MPPTDTWSPHIEQREIPFEFVPAEKRDGSGQLMSWYRVKENFGDDQLMHRCALAYLSVAQYDALVSAYLWKKEYGRKSPSKNDSSIIPTKPVTDLPSYPSEEAVIASASYAILLNMFPGEAPFLEAKLAEAKNAGLWAGTNVTSDVVVGEALGKAVAVKVLTTKASVDGMGAANNQSLMEVFTESAKSRGLSVFWKSQELPIRPPMLPNFGALKTWHLSKTILNEIRPILPYTIESAEWKKELDELKEINKNQTRDQAKLANYWSDGAGSYTPPGHWNAIASEDFIGKNYKDILPLHLVKLFDKIIPTILSINKFLFYQNTKFYPFN